MKKILRVFASFGYSLIIACLASGIAVFIWASAMTYADGFWQHAAWGVGMLIALAWLSERGVEISSVVYNWLWDSGVGARIATSIPPLLIGIWICSAPFRLDVKFTVGDIILTVLWELLNLFLYFNLISLPWLNSRMGRNL